MSPLLAQLGTNPASGFGLPPHWGWYVILYFFFGGLAAGSYFIATLLAWQGDPRDRNVVQLGYLLALPLVVVCGILLIVDLGVPLRFWHMIIRSKDVPWPLLKPWSPMSLGSWVLVIFGLFSFVAFIGALVERGRLRQPWVVSLDRRVRSLPRLLRVAWSAVGAFFGFFLAGYTGVLLTGTSIAVWHNARLLGALFLISAASTSYALLMLLLLRRGAQPSDVTVRKLGRADRYAIWMELGAIALVVILLGRVARPIVGGGFGILFWLGVVGVGLLVPLFLHRVHPQRWTDRDRAVASAACVLLGGLLLRFVVVMGPQHPEVPLWYL